MSVFGQPWWDQWPGRLDDEREALRRKGLEFEPDDEERARGRIVLRGRAPIQDGAETNLVIVYPDTFPHQRPWIYAPDLNLERHQHPFQKNLCVPARGAENWRPTMRAADLIAVNVPELVEAVHTGGDTLREAEEPQGEPHTSYFEYLPTGGILVPPEMLRIDPSVEQGRFSITHRDGKQWLECLTREPEVEDFRFGQALLRKLTRGKDQLIAEADDRLIKRFHGPTWHGNWVRLSGAPGRGRAEEVLEDLHDRLPRLKYAERIGDFRAELIGIAFPEEVRQGEWEDAWMFLLAVRGSGPQQGKRGAQFIRGMRLGRRDLSARIPELRTLPSKTVSIAGVGAIGAPVSYGLARGQIGILRLLDDDFVEAGTAVRWPHGLEAAGTQKVLFLARQLRENYPYTEVEPFQHRIGAAPLHPPERSEANTLDRWADGTDLIIDATTDANVQRTLGFAAHPAGIPQIYVHGIEGYGGVVARLVPGRTGCVVCLERALADGGHITPPPAPEDPERHRVQPRGCADPTVTATDPDLAPLATEAVRFAYSTLSEGHRTLTRPRRTTSWCCAFATRTVHSRHPAGMTTACPRTPHASSAVDDRFGEHGSRSVARTTDSKTNARSHHQKRDGLRRSKRLHS